MNPLFPCDHGAATHSCIMHDTKRGRLHYVKMRPGCGFWITFRSLTIAE